MSSEAPPALNADEASIAALAPRAELRALLRLLFARGFGWESLRFAGVREVSGATGLVHSVSFEGSAPRRALVRLNLGLLTPNGPLPAYFRRFAAELEDSSGFGAFIEFFEHTLLQTYAFTLHPREGVAASVPLGHAYRLLADFDSTPRLHWLFRAVIPELPVAVRSVVFHAARPADGARVGSAALDGTSIVGPHYRVTQRGYSVRLYAEEETNSAGQAWEGVVRERFRAQILPLLGQLRCPLELKLHFAEYGSGAEIKGSAQLGLRRLRTLTPEAWEVLLQEA